MPDVGNSESQSLCGGETRADNPLCGFNNPLESIPFLLCDVSKPHTDPFGQDAFRESSVGLGERLTAQSCFFFQPPDGKKKKGGGKKKKHLLSSFDCGCGVY